MLTLRVPSGGTTTLSTIELTPQMCLDTHTILLCLDVCMCVGILTYILTNLGSFHTPGTVTVKKLKL